MRMRPYLQLQNNSPPRPALPEEPFPLLPATDATPTTTGTEDNYHLKKGTVQKSTGQHDKEQAALTSVDNKCFLPQLPLKSA